MGGYGDAVTVRLSAADILGNSLSNYVWAFKLAQETIVGTNVIFLDSTLGRGLRSIDPAKLTLISTNGDLFMYRFTGTFSGLQSGDYLVDPSLYTGYRRGVVSVIEDSVSQIVVVVTKRAPIAALLEQGSLTPSSFTELTTGPQPKWEAGAGLDFSQTIDLSTTLYEDPNVRIEITEGSKLDLKAKLVLSANFKWLKLII